MEKLKILVVDHSVISRKTITDIVNTTDLGMVQRSASGGQIALEWLQQSGFDVVLMDVQVVREVGVEQIRILRRLYPGTEIILMSDQDPESAAVTLEAMNMGALDFILRPNHTKGTAVGSNIKGELEAIFTQIKVQQFLPKAKACDDQGPMESGPSEKKQFVGDIDLVLIASSTGGPVALETICRKLPSDYSKPVLIVQHMPPEFTHVLAASFNKKFKTTVTEGKSGDALSPGHIIIAPGGFHMVLEEGFGKTAGIHLLDTPMENGVKPSADILFKSVARVYKGRNILVVVLTGMGNDGTKGVRALKESCNCYCITQSEKSCVVYGMPKCVYEAGLSDEVVNLEDIAHRMCQLTESKGGIRG